MALSGGVDSSVAASILKAEGHDVEALCIKMSPLHNTTVAAAEKAAARFSMPIHILDGEELFKDIVISDFVNEYKNGRTPNPCIICNRSVKFHLLYDYAVKNGFDKIATGHYAKIKNVDGKNYIAVAENLKKDQSYMLYRLPSHIIDSLIFPLGSIETKEDVRAVAKSDDLPSANAPDSQEICFIENEGYADYIERNFGPSLGGRFIGPNGEDLGKHKGIMNYTIGQRKGLGIAYSEPIYVKEIDHKSGNISLCRSGEEFFSGVKLKGVFLPHPIGEKSFSAKVKIRYAAKPETAEISLTEDGGVVLFNKSLRACCPGQSVVFYKDDVVLGGGFIDENI